ncbi:hypothetical protein [Bacillus sp. OK048]|nr:hypothetical protein [Bacillus sp. OK048]
MRGEEKVIMKGMMTQTGVEIRRKGHHEVADDQIPDWVQRKRSS